MQTPMQSPQKAEEVYTAPSLSFQSDTSSRHPRSEYAKMVRNLEKYPMLKACESTCKLKCTTKFSEVERARIHEIFWDGNYENRYRCIAHFVKEFEKSRSTAENSRRNYSRIYTFHQTEIDVKCMEAGRFNYFYEDGVRHSCDSYHIQVCKKFYLSTLGLTADKRITKALEIQRNDDSEGHKVVKDNRGGKQRKD